MENLDLKCAELGARLAHNEGGDEKLLTDALAVLEEQGVYAFFLFLKAKRGTPGETLSDACFDFLKKTPKGMPLLADTGGNVFKAIQCLNGDLDALLHARDLLRQGIAYGRYHAKCKNPPGATR